MTQTVGQSDAEAGVPVPAVEQTACPEDAAKPPGRRRPVLVDTLLLAACFCVGMGSLFAAMGFVSVVVEERVDAGLALVPLALQRCVATAVAYPAAHLRSRWGYASAAIVGSIGAAIGVLAMAVFDDGVTSFVVLCVGHCVMGVSDPFVLMLRFSAADIVPEELKARSISYVVAGGALAAFTGPELARALSEVIPDRPLAGSYLAPAGLLLLEAVLVLFVDFTPATPPQRTVAAQKGAPEEQSKEAQAQQGRLPLRALVGRRLFVLAASTAAISQLTMTSMMQISPLVMKQEGFKIWHSVRVIQGHILGMYVPSFFTGHLIGYAGKLPVMWAGLFLNVVAACSLIPFPDTFWSYFSCLTLIGVGWNWAYVGASSLLAEATSNDSATDKARATGLNDLCIQLLWAAGSCGTGFATSAFGWAWLVGINASLLALQLCVVMALGCLKSSCGGWRAKEET